MTGQYDERAFETVIKVQLLANGYMAADNRGGRGGSVLRQNAVLGAEESVVVAKLSDEQRVGLNFVDHPMLIRDAS